MRGFYDKPCIYSETDPCFVNCNNTSCPEYEGEEDEEDDE